MNTCELMNSCPFYNEKMDHSSEITAELKEKYCNSNNLNCSIYMVINSLGADKIPSDLLPSEKERVYILLAEN
ncbi:MAG: hypothetical protein PF518_12200 [Spirochaetaceae bacterium]|jgi:hypothetical protein|nr:hypothetical protein [Spirochaetaceae bacterium]